MDRIHNPYHWIITYKYVIWYSVCRCNGVYDGCVRDEDELECTGGSYALLTHTVLYKRWSNLVLFCNFRKATSFCPSSIFSGSQFQRNQRIWPRAGASQMRQSFHFQQIWILGTTMHRIIKDRMKNGIKGSRIGYNLR